ARLGGKLSFARGDWDVVGVMDAGQSALNSEIFADLNQISSDFNRSEVLSSALIRASDRVAMRALANDLENDPRLNVMAPTEREYYDNAKQSGMVIQFLGTFIAIIMAVGSAFAAMNTMYAAVARRSAEIGTLRVLGFSRGAILTSFFLESVLLCLLGGVIGVLLVLPLGNVTTGIGSWVSFSEVAFNFQVSPRIMLTGILFALLLGAAGGFFPARFAAKKEILAALREG
ncbi:MAG: ABC transporter permease, partial [Acidobacteria bacterium]|nr:ABC transporter permease [Acidobacteriota bacterium]